MDEPESSLATVFHLEDWPDELELADQVQVGGLARAGELPDARSPRVEEELILDADILLAMAEICDRSSDKLRRAAIVYRQQAVENMHGARLSPYPDG